MPRAHTHVRTAERRSLLWVLGISAAFLVAEVTGGLISGSLALLADAGHLLTDVVAIGVALAAFWFAGQQSSGSRTYGYARAEIMAGLLNGLSLVLVSAYVGFEGVRRIASTPEIDAGIVLGVGAAGLVANIVGAVILRRGARENLNVKGVFLHLVGDGVSSVAVLASALIIILTGWNMVDPIIAIFIALLILFAAGRLVIATVDVLMEAAPRGVSLPGVRAAMLRDEAVQAVHDLHVWTLTSGCVAMSAHVVRKRESDQAAVLARLRRLVKRGFGIDHLTLQIEDDGLQDEDVHLVGDPRCLA